jgi:hypothetical protein
MQQPSFFPGAVPRGSRHKSATRFGDFVVMAPNTSAAYGSYPHDVSLQHVVQMLHQSGFGSEQICLMVQPRHHIATVMRQANVLDTERAASAASVELISWLMKLGAVVIPTVGLFIRSRAFLHDLIMGDDSAGLCGDENPLVGLGFSEVDADRFENELREMGVLVYVACSEKAKAIEAVEVFRRSGARECAALDASEAALTAAA